MRILKICKKCEHLRCNFYQDAYTTESWEFTKQENGLWSVKGKNVMLKFCCSLLSKNLHYELESLFMIQKLPKNCPYYLEHTVAIGEKKTVFVSDNGENQNVDKQ